MSSGSKKGTHKAIGCPPAYGEIDIVIYYVINL